MRTLAHLSDLHFGRHDPVIAEALLASLAEHRPDLVVISGDLTQRARPDEFKEARSFLDRIATPTLVVAGNHDIQLYNLLGRLVRPLARFDRYISPIRRPVFVDDEIAVLGLHTVRRATGKNGRVSFLQMDEIRKVFSALPASLFKVLVTHHPLVSPSGATLAFDPVGRSRAALEAVAEVGVHLLLSGHYHRAVSGGAPAHVARPPSLLVVHAGTAVSTRTRGGEANTYNLIRIERLSLSVAVMGVAKDRGFAEARRERYRFAAGRWQNEPREVKATGR